MMNLNVHPVHFTADSKLIQLVGEKTNKLQEINDKITDVDVYLKLENTSENIKDKVVEIKLNVMKKSLFVKEVSKTFEGALEMALTSMVEQVKKTKSRKRA